MLLPCSRKLDLCRALGMARASERTIASFAPSRGANHDSTDCEKMLSDETTEMSLSFEILRRLFAFDDDLSVGMLAKGPYGML